MKPLLIILTPILSLFANSALACSLAFPNLEDVEALFHDALALELNTDPGDIPNNVFTEPQTTFLQPLGVDCSGIESIFMSSAYYWEASYNWGTCKHKGVAILSGFTLDSDVLIQDSTTCLGIPPTPPHALAGEYKNASLNYDHISRLKISNDGQSVEVWGKCGTGECPWGSAQLTDQTDTSAKATYYFRNLKRELMILEGLNVDLEVHTTTTSVVDGSLIYQRIESFNR